MNASCPPEDKLNSFVILLFLIILAEAGVYG
jgi:hypothetical protein